LALGAIIEATRAAAVVMPYSGQRFQEASRDRKIGSPSQILYIVPMLRRNAPLTPMASLGRRQADSLRQGDLAAESLDNVRMAVHAHRAGA
jgi:hypothetical protein